MTDSTFARQEQPPRKRARHARRIGSEDTPTPEVFEDALSRLDEIVAQLEGGQLPLDQALSLYEEGVRLFHLCQTMLETAELRLERLRIDATLSEEADDDTSTEPFELDER